MKYFPPHSHCHSTFHRKCHNRVSSKLLSLNNFFCLNRLASPVKNRKLKTFWEHRCSVSCFQEYVIFQKLETHFDTILKVQGKVWILVIEFWIIKVSKAKCTVNNSNKRVFQNQVKAKSMIKIIRNLLKFCLKIYRGLIEN